MPVWCWCCRCMGNCLYGNGHRAHPNPFREAHRPGRDDHQHRHRRQLHRVEQRPLRRPPAQIIPPPPYLKGRFSLIPLKKNIIKKKTKKTAKISNKNQFQHSHTQHIIANTIKRTVPLMVFLLVMLLPLPLITKNHIYGNFFIYIYGSFILTFIGILF